jgi:glycosyltransferase involved in cell wall biosynthesis
MSSRKEGLPYVVLEAMSAALSIVATDSSGVDSLIATGVNGIVVPRGDAAAFGKALTALVSDPALRERYGRGSLERIRHFTIDSMVDQTLALYAGAGAAHTTKSATPHARVPIQALAEVQAELSLATVGGAEMDGL